MLTRLTLISASIALGCLATIAPVLTSLYVADEDVERREQRDLRDVADKALMRAELVTYQAFAALADLAGCRVPSAPRTASRTPHASFSFTAKFRMRVLSVTDSTSARRFWATCG